MKQTAVEWFIQQIFKIDNDMNIDEIIDKAKEMEKEQIKDAYLRGIKNYDPTFKLE